MGDLVSGRSNINRMQETGELGPNVNHAQADGCMGRFHGGGSGAGGSGSSSGYGGGSGAGGSGSSSGYGGGSGAGGSSSGYGGDSAAGGSGSASTTGASGVSTGSNGELVLGNTSINFIGGTPEQTAMLEQVFTSMYNSDPAFKQVIDSKSSTGISLDFYEYADNTAGMAMLGGNTMTMDIGYLNSNPDISKLAEVVAHEVGHLAGMDHGSALDSFAITAGQSA